MMPPHLENFPRFHRDASPFERHIAEAFLGAGVVLVVAPSGIVEVIGTAAGRAAVALTVRRFPEAIGKALLQEPVPFVAQGFAARRIVTTRAIATFERERPFLNTRAVLAELDRTPGAAAAWGGCLPDAGALEVHLKAWVAGPSFAGTRLRDIHPRGLRKSKTHWWIARADDDMV